MKNFTGLLRQEQIQVVDEPVRTPLHNIIIKLPSLKLPKHEKYDPLFIWSKMMDNEIFRRTF